MLSNILKPFNCPTISGAPYKPTVSVCNSPVPVSLTCCAFNILPCWDASDAVLNNHPPFKPSSPILSKAIFWAAWWVKLPAVCNTEDFKLFSSPKSFLNTEGSSSPLRITRSSKPRFFLAAISIAIKGSSIS